MINDGTFGNLCNEISCYLRNVYINYICKLRINYIILKLIKYLKKTQKNGSENNS